MTEYRRKSIFQEWKSDASQHETIIENITRSPLLFRVESVVLDNWFSGVIHRWVLIKLSNEKLASSISFKDGEDIYTPISDAMLSGQVHPGHQNYTQNGISDENNSSYFHLDIGDKIVFVIKPSNIITDKVVGIVSYSVVSQYDMLSSPSALREGISDIPEIDTHTTIINYYRDVPEIPEASEIMSNGIKWSSRSFDIFMIHGEKIIIHYTYDIYHMLITNFARVLYNHTSNRTYADMDFWMSKEFIRELKQRLIDEPSLTFYPIVDIMKAAKDLHSLDFTKSSHIIHDREMISSTHPSHHVSKGHVFQFLDKSRIETPHSIVITPKENMVLAFRNHRNIKVFTMDGKYVTGWNTQEPPTALATDSRGRLYVGDTSGIVEIFSNELCSAKQRLDLNASSGSPNISGISGMCIDPVNNDIYVVDHRNMLIQVFANSGEYIRTLKLDQFKSPYGIDISTKGNLIISDNITNIISVLDKKGNLIRRFGETGSYPGQLKEPTGVKTIGRENIFICDSGNNRIQVFNESGKLISTYGKSPGEFNYPQSIATHMGNAYITDTGNNRIQMISVWEILDG